MVEDFYHLLYKSHSEVYVDAETELEMLTIEKNIFNRGSEIMPDFILDEIELTLEKTKPMKPLERTVSLTMQRKLVVQLY